MATAKSVAFAETAVTVHVARSDNPGELPDGTVVWDVESKVMLPGESLPLKIMPPYLSSAIKEGKVPGLVAMTPGQAKRVNEMYSSQSGLASAYLESEEQDEDSELQDED